MRSNRWIFFFLALMPSLAFAWDNYALILVAELAKEKLTPAMARQLEADAYAVVRQRSSEKRLELMRGFPTSSAFGQLAVLAEEEKNHFLSDVFTRFGDQMPQGIDDLLAETTESWHFDVQPYLRERYREPGSEDISCSIEHGFSLSEAIPLVIEQLKTAEGANKTLWLALLSHLVADAHQPLHTTTKVNDNCETDQAGEKFCLIYSPGGRGCKTTLHTFWDASLNYFEQYETLADARDTLQRISHDSAQTKNLRVSDWIAESHRYARFVYSVKEGSGGDQYYVDEGQIIAYERIALAGARLAAIIESVY